MGTASSDRISAEIGMPARQMSSAWCSFVGSFSSSSDGTELIDAMNLFASLVSMRRA